VRSYVESLTPDKLVELVLERTRSDAVFHRRLVDTMRSASGLGVDMTEWTSRLDDAFAPFDGFVDYREAAAWASDVHATLAESAMLNTAGHHDAAIELCEHALARAEAAIQYVDDSDGWITPCERDRRYPPRRLSRRPPGADKAKRNLRKLLDQNGW